MQSEDQATAGERRAFRPNEVAKLLGISRSRVYELMTEGKLRAVKDGRNTLIPSAELDRWLAALPTRES